MKTEQLLLIAAIGAAVYLYSKRNVKPGTVQTDPNSRNPNKTDSANIAGVLLGKGVDIVSGVVTDALKNRSFDVGNALQKNYGSTDMSDYVSHLA